MAVGAVAALAAGCASSEQESVASSNDITTATAAPIEWNVENPQRYHRLATYPIFENRPEGEPIDTETVAEISSVTPDGNTMIYTDATAQRIGFLDISDPSTPRGLGTLSLTELGNADDQPTSVIVHQDFVLVVVDTTGGDFTAPSGRADVVRIADRTRVHSIDLGGQPDSIALSPDGTFAAVAIENQRDEDFTPEGGEEGDLPQPPTGFVQIVDLTGEPQAWTTRRVDFDVDQARAAGLDTPEDLEPEYVDVNDRGEIAVTLQENNGIAVIDGPTGEVTSLFSAGTASVEDIDTVEDGVIDQTGSITDLPREPDAIGWIGDRYLATANEGDWKGGTRNWSIFDAATGDLVWDGGNEFSHLAVRTGLHNEGRAEAKGPEPEGLTITELDGRPVALVGSERSNFVAVYDVSDPTDPQFRQILPATNGPEGILAVPERNLLATSSEVDDAEAGVRASVTLYGWGEEHAAAGGSPAFPSLVSGDVDGLPVGWGALGALSVDPEDPDRLFTATDDAYGPARVLGIDLTQTPALIDREIAVTEDGQPLTLDIEGVAARRDGGFYLAVEGAEGPENALLRVAEDGAIEERIGLPDDIGAALGSQGLEGVSVQGSGDDETVWVVLQRELDTDPPGVARIGRYTPADGGWQWYGYQLDPTDVDGDWIGLSEITVHDGALLILERDKLNGPAARIKAIHRVEIPTESGVPGADAEVTVLPKTLYRDLLPDLRATRGWVQEKAEGVAVAGNGNLYVVTDNDGLDDATGETVFLDLGPAQ